MANKQYDWLIIADGEPLSPRKLRELANGKKTLVLDGAIYHVDEAKVPVNVLLGDFDAVNPTSLLHRQTMEIVEAPDQNKTDLEKGIEYLDQLSTQGIAIAAATGKRLQHTLYNLRILKKYYRMDRPLSMYSENEYICYYQDEEITVEGKIGDPIAILGFPTGLINTSGLKYDVQEYRMEFEKNNSISNSLLANKAKIKVQGSVLVIHETAGMYQK